MNPDDDPDFECLAILAEHSQDVKSIIFSPISSGVLFSASYDDTIKAWQADVVHDDEWRCKQTISTHSSTVWAIALDPSGTILFSVGDDRAVGVHRLNEKKFQCIAKQNLAHDRYICSVDIFREDLKLLNSNVSDANRNNTEAKDEDDVSVPESAILAATCAGDRKIKVWEYDNQTCVLLEAGHYDIPERGEANCVKWNPKIPGLLALAGDDGLVALLEIKRKSEGEVCHH
jgi:WD40 repeat protein